MEFDGKYLPRTWTTKREAELLIKYTEAATGDVFEVGTFRGGTTELFGTHLDPQYAVYSIDPYFDSYEGKHDDYDAVTITRNYLADFSNVFLLVGYSQNLGKFWNREIVLLFLDGAHDYESVKVDFQRWARFVPASGVVIFHDSQASGIKRVISGVIASGKWEVIEKADKITVVKRKAV